jgi:hypothetical protein
MKTTRLLLAALLAAAAAACSADVTAPELTAPAGASMLESEPPPPPDPGPEPTEAPDDTGIVGSGGGRG